MYLRKLSFKKEKGSVLVIALLLMTVIAAISTKMLLHGRGEIEQTNQIALNDRIYLDLQGYQYWAIQTLGSFPEEEGFLPTPFKATVFDWGAHISGQWQDQQGLFNLNALLNNEDAREGFLRLLLSVSQGMERVEALKIMDEIRAYLNRVKSMLSISELRSIKSVSQGLFLSLERYVTALPEGVHEVNINSVDVKDPRVLLTVFDASKSLRDIQSLMACRDGGFIQKKVQFDAFLLCLSKRGALFKPEHLTYFSRYFLAVGRVRLKAQYHTLYSLLERVRGKKNRVRLRWQSLDTR